MQFKTITHCNNLEDLIATIKKINSSERIMIICAHSGYMLSNEVNDMEIKSLIQKHQIFRNIEFFKKDSNKSIATLILN